MCGALGLSCSHPGPRPLLGASPLHRMSSLSRFSPHPRSHGFLLKPVDTESRAALRETPIAPAPQRRPASGAGKWTEASESRRPEVKYGAAAPQAAEADGVGYASAALLAFPTWRDQSRVNLALWAQRGPCGVWRRRRSAPREKLSNHKGSGGH